VRILAASADALDALEENLTGAVRLRMIADGPLGALLSGGVDSSVVVPLMAKLSNQPVRTFSIGFEEETFNELPWARQAAERCGTQHHPEIANGDVDRLLPMLARHYGEPFADDSALPSFLVSATARRHVTVALNGDGGDELLGGYARYWLSNSVIRSSALLGGTLPPTRLADMALVLHDAKTIHGRVVRKLLMEYSNPELRWVVMFADFWHDAARRELLPDGPSVLLRNWRRRWLEGAFAHADNPIDWMLWLDSHIYLPDCLLRSA
jgi:asparagine synthase (glutamine-hydrolysing)